MIDWSSGKLRILELAGAGAVLLGLVFVGLELRQNTNAIQAATFQSLIDSGSDWLSDIYSNPELARIWSIALSDSAQLESSELMQVSYLLRNQWLRMQNAFSQWQRGSLSDSDWAVYEALICVEPSQSPSGQASRLRIETWEDHQETLTEEFMTFVEDCWVHHGRAQD